MTAESSEDSQDSLDEEETVNEGPQNVSRSSRYGRIRRGAEQFNYQELGGNPKITRYSYKNK